MTFISLLSHCGQYFLLLSLPQPVSDLSACINSQSILNIAQGCSFPQGCSIALVPTSFQGWFLVWIDISVPQLCPCGHSGGAVGHKSSILQLLEAALLQPRLSSSTLQSPGNPQLFLFPGISPKRALESSRMDGWAGLEPPKLEQDELKEESSLQDGLFRHCSWQVSTAAVKYWLATSSTFLLSILKVCQNFHYEPLILWVYSFAIKIHLGLSPGTQPFGFFQHNINSEHPDSVFKHQYLRSCCFFFLSFFFFPQVPCFLQDSPKNQRWPDVIATRICNIWKPFLEGLRPVIRKKERKFWGHLENSQARWEGWIQTPKAELTKSDCHHPKNFPENSRKEERWRYKLKYSFWNQIKGS